MQNSADATLLSGSLMVLPTSLVFALGLFSAAHCLAMCGGIANALLMGGRTSLLSAQKTPEVISRSPTLIASSATATPVMSTSLTLPMMAAA